MSEDDDVFVGGLLLFIFFRLFVVCC